MISTISSISAELLDNVGKNQNINTSDICQIVDKISLVINQMTNFQKLTLIISFISVVVNAGVVFVAIWSANIPYKKDINLQITSFVQMLLDAGNQLKTFGLIITNKGHINVKLVQWGFTYDKKHKYQFVETKIDRFPVEIRCGDSNTFQFPMNVLLKMLKETSNNEKHKVYFYVLDSSGKYYYVKLRENVNDFINRETECCNDDNWNQNYYQF